MRNTVCCIPSDLETCMLLLYLSFQIQIPVLVTKCVISKIPVKRIWTEC